MGCAQLCAALDCQQEVGLQRRRCLLLLPLPLLLLLLPLLLLKVSRCC
jgi:hypothetical protein